MKNTGILVSITLTLLLLFLWGCELETIEGDPPLLRPATNLVINELFTLPATHSAVHTWLEFYNPTRDTIDLTGWTLTFTTRRSLVRFNVADTLGSPVVFTARVISQEYGTYEIPFPISGTQPPFAWPRIPGGEFLTIVGNESRMLDYIRAYGVGRGPTVTLNPFVITGRINLDLPVSFGIPNFTPGDTVITIPFYDFHFQASDQIIVKDDTGTIVDVVRWGNYTFTGTVTSPLLGPGNRSYGMIPEFQSLARFAGAYFTGSTADDFYHTGSPQYPNTIPIPHGYSVAYKR
jgi:hypothetical protein